MKQPKILKLTKDLKGHHTKDDIKITNKHMKKSSTLYVIQEMQNKTIMSNDYTPIRVAQTQTVTAPQAGEAVE